MALRCDVLALKPYKYTRSRIVCNTCDDDDERVRKLTYALVESQRLCGRRVERTQRQDRRSECLNVFGKTFGYINVEVILSRSRMTLPDGEVPRTSYTTTHRPPRPTHQEESRV